MITKEHVERLVEAHQRVRSALDHKRFLPQLPGTRERRAAGILCDELGTALLDNSEFWEGLYDASVDLAKHRDMQREIFGNLRKLVESEELIFDKLGIDKEKSSSIIEDVYSALRIVKEYEDPSPDSLRNLRDRIGRARELVCKESKGPLHRSLDKLVGAKGARVIAGATVMGANAAIVLIDQGGVSWVSLKAGYYIAKGDVDALEKLLEGGGIDVIDV